MMNKQPPSLVDALAEQNPVLFATYKKTEEVAINHWYPGMSQSNGSVNSYPHVQGIINQLIKIRMRLLSHRRTKPSPRRRTRL